MLDAYEFLLMLIACDIPYMCSSCTYKFFLVHLWVYIVCQFLFMGHYLLIWYFCSQMVQFSKDQILEVKKVSNSHLRLLGFKPLDCLKDYHNLRPSTFIFPTDEVRLNIFFISRLRLNVHLHNHKWTRYCGLSFSTSGTFLLLYAVIWSCISLMGLLRYKCAAWDHLCLWWKFRGTCDCI